MPSIIITIFVYLFTFLSGLLVGPGATQSYFLALYHRLEDKGNKELSSYYLPAETVKFSPIKELRVIPPTTTEAPVAKDNANIPDMNVSSSVAIDLNQNKIVFEYEADKQQPIASITKLMTALVFLDHNPGWDKEYTFQKIDNRDGGKNYFFPGDEVKVKDLFYAMLVASDNSAVIGLVHAAGFTESDFVDRMNKKAQALGLVNTSFADPTGLHTANVSTAKEVARFARIALDKEPVKTAVLTPSYSFKTGQGKKRVLYSTDQLLGKKNNDYKLEGGKTGFLNSAGYCFVGKFSNKDKRLVTVVLGADDKNARFTETEKLLDWVDENNN